MRVLISGGGIAGPALAWWLRHYGMECVIVERAPELRSGGYIIDFWGAGFEVADRMGIVPAIREAAYIVQELRIVDDEGKRAGGFSVDVFQRLTGGRYVSLPRSALSAILFGAIANEVETIFGNSIAALEQRGAQVHVDFERGPSRTFDAVLGADGLHSRVRALAFGPQPAFERYLGYGVAAFEVAGYRPRDEDVYVMYTDVGRQIGRFSMRGDRTMFLFIFSDREGVAAGANSLTLQKAFLRDRFGSCGWEAARILDAMESVETIYFDRVSQIRMDAWSRGRIGLVGDAAYCVSLLGGQGSALAMIGAYALAYELHRGTPEEAFQRYHRYLATFIANKQNAARGFAESFVPSSRLRLRLRNQLSKLFAIPWFARLAARRGLLDRIELPGP